MRNFPKLEEGMRVKTRNGNIYVILQLDGSMNLFRREGYLKLSSYRENKSCKEGLVTPPEEWDIVKVYSKTATKGLDSMLKVDEDELIWEELEVVEVTIDDIAEMLGVPVECLKIKK